MTMKNAAAIAVVILALLAFIAGIATISVIVQAGYHYTCTTQPGTVDCTWTWWL